MKESYCRIDGVIARGANKAVIFRRGPTKYTQMLLWDLNTDVVTPGQWLKARINYSYVSDDGNYVAIHAQHYGKVSKRELERMYHWVAVSHPPYFTAVGVWESSAYGVSSLPTSENNLKSTPLPERAIALANELYLAEHGNNEWEPQFETDGGRRYFETFKYYPSENVILKKKVTNGMIFRYLKASWSKDPKAVVMQFADINSEIRHTIYRESGVGWAEVDAKGRIIFADKGCLWAWANFPEGEPKLIADLNGNTFEEVAPPDWALRP